MPTGRHPFATRLTASRQVLQQPSRGLAARLRDELSFHFPVDVTTLLASVATVVTLVLLLHDRREQADIAAWTMLQAYLDGDPYVAFNDCF